MGLLDAVVGAATGFVVSGGNPAAAFASGVQADKEARARKKNKRIANEQAAQEAERMEIFGSTGSSPSTLSRNLAATTPTIGTQSSGEGFFSTVRSGLREFGGFVGDAFNSGIPQLFGVSRPRGVGQQPAITTVTNLGAQESQGSGSIQAGMGSLLPSVVSGARSLLKSPLGQLTLGTGAAGAISLMGSDGKQMRITRKMKSQARMVLNLAQGNISVAADILNISEDMLITILLKRFRNDGAVVTKAALRKTKSTIRKLHNMQDVLKSITPTASGRKRAPMKRATTTTLIKN
tara:strand:+ start:346 stop:1221 length:876 start_codon:yes stop_codon:yes gene_type:complete